MEDLDAVVAGVGHRDPAVGADGDAGRVVEAARAIAGRPEGKRERAVGVEDLDAVGDGVEYGDPAVGADGDGVWIIELAVAVAGRPEGKRERAVGVEDLDAVVAGVGHDNDSRLQAMRRKCGGRRWEWGARAIDR